MGVYNVKGGVGKTAAAVNLAHRSALQGNETLVWDLDAQGAATFYFGARAGLAGGTEDLLRKGAELSPWIRGTSVEGLDLVPSDPDLRKLDLDLRDASKPRKRVERLLEPMRARYDVVVLDCPPSLSVLAEALFRTVDVLLVPTIPSTLSLRSLSLLMRHLKEGQRPPLILPFFSLVDARKRMHREVMSWTFEHDLGFLRTTIPYASEVEQMGERRAPVAAYARRSRGAKAFEELWLELCARVLAARTSA